MSQTTTFRMCPKCNARNPDSYKACWSCGLSFAPAAPAAPAVPVVIQAPHQPPAPVAAMDVGEWRLRLLGGWCIAVFSWCLFFGGGSYAIIHITGIDPLFFLGCVTCATGLIATFFSLAYLRRLYRMRGDSTLEDFRRTVWLLGILIALPGVALVVASYRSMTEDVAKKRELREQIERMNQPPQRAYNPFPGRR